MLKARQRGQVAVSRDLSGALAFAALVAVFAAAAPIGMARLLGLFQRSLSVSSSGAPTFAAAGMAALDAAWPILIVPLATALGVAVVVGAVQTGGLVAWQAVTLDLGRLSPSVGLRRLFSVRTPVEIGFGLVKVALVLGIAGVAVWPAVRELPGLAGARPLDVLTAMGVLLERVAVRVAMALVVLGLIDWLLVRHRHHRALMMTRDEIRREYRQTEGDPRHRAERQRLHREIGEQRMIEDVRKADFVVVNPDHIAVAVKYDREADAAPVVIAKGERLLAERIKQVARESGVPIYRDLALARALNELPEGEEIPEVLYEAVAELLRVLWEIDRADGASPASPSGAHPTEGDSTRARTTDSAPPPSTSATWKRV